MKKIDIAIGIASISLTVLFSGCGATKDYERPADINTDGIYGDAQTEGEESLGDLKWREIFTDPTLQALIEKVLAQNTDMINADIQLQEVQYTLKASKLAFVPSMYFTPDMGVTKMYDPYNRNSYSSMTSGNSKTYELPVTFGWQSVNFAQLRNQKKGVEVTKKQMENAKQAVQASLVANVANMYYNLAMFDEQLDMMTQTEENWGKYLDMERKLMAAGQANTAAVKSIEATYYSICTSVTSLKENIRLVENSLSTLMGETAHGIERQGLASFQAPSILSTGVPITLLSRRPDVKESELTLAGAFYDTKAARAAFWPSLTITAAGEYTNSVGTSIINPGMMIGNAIASLTQPIFANGKLRAQYKISKLDMEIASNNFQQTVIAAGNEVNTAMVQLNTAEQLRDLYGKQVDALKVALDATQKLYVNSSGNYLNVITAQNSLISAEMDFISNRMDAISATISLYEALGGGTD
ncbi:MAG: TolC family protein [Prevotellaceae bacterium]|nr:TolC family protein [Prevotellaceae bacterium]